MIYPSYNWAIENGRLSQCKSQAGWMYLLTLWYHTKYINLSGQSECSCSYSPLKSSTRPAPGYCVWKTTQHILYNSPRDELSHTKFHLYTKLLLSSEVPNTTHHGMWKTTQHILCYSQREEQLSMGWTLSPRTPSCIWLHLSKLPPTTQHGTHVKRHFCRFLTTLHGMITYTQLRLAKLLLLASLHNTSWNTCEKTTLRILCNYPWDEQ